MEGTGGGGARFFNGAAGAPRPVRFPMKGVPMSRCPLLLIPALLLAAGATSWADVTIVSKIDDKPQTIQAAEHRVAMTGPEGGMIFRGDRKLMWMIDPEKKSYSEMTEADMQAMAARMNEAMAQLEAMKSQLPPGMLEQMKKAMPAAGAPKRTVKPTGASKEINGFPCKEYLVTSDDGIVNDVWSTDPASVRLQPGDLAAFKEFAEFLKTMIPGMDAMNDWAKDFDHPKEDQVPGVPILSVLKDKGGNEITRVELVKVEHGAVAPSAFEVPAGFSKKAFQGMED
jgi:hypothetical protein